MPIDESTACELTARRMNEDPRALRARKATSGKFSTTFFITGGREDRVIRISPPDDMLLLFYERRMMRQEPAIHRLIQKRTPVPIPTILDHDFSRQWIDRDYLIMRRLPGRPLSDVRHELSPAALDDILHGLGRNVAMLHTIRTRRHGYLGAHRPMPPAPDWPTAFATLWEKMLADCAACGVYDGDDCRLATRLWRDYHRCFDPKTPAVLCHMDLWITNVMVSDGKFEALFDFDRCCFGDRENDLTVAEYCGLTGPAFERGYVSAPAGAGSWPVESDERAVRRWFYLLYEHQKYIVISMSVRRDDPIRAKRYAKECRLAMQRFARTGRPEF